MKYKERRHCYQLQQIIEQYQAVSTSELVLGPGGDPPRQLLHSSKLGFSYFYFGY